MARKEHMGKHDYRRSNGRRLEGHGLAARLVNEVIGMQLAAAFVTVRSAGLQLSVKRLDGVPRKATCASATLDTLHVDVVEGVVKKCWTC